MEEFKEYVDIDNVKLWIKTNHLYINDALRWSAQHGRIGAIREIIKAGVNICESKNEAFRISATMGYLEIMKDLIDAGADIHAENNDALISSAARGYLEVVRELIRAGAYIRAKDDAALRYSAENGHRLVVCELMKAGANVRAKNDAALRYSVFNGHLEVMHEVIKFGLYKCNDILMIFNNYNPIILQKIIKYYYIGDYNSQLAIILKNTRIEHYSNIMSIMFDLPCELYDAISKFI